MANITTDNYFFGSQLSLDSNHMAEKQQTLEEPDSALSASSTDYDSAEEESAVFSESRRPSQTSSSSRKSPSGDDSGSEMAEDFEYKINDAIIAFRHLVNNEYLEGYNKFCAMSDVSLYHMLGKLTTLTAIDLSTFKKHRIQNTLSEISKGYQLISKHRKKRSAAKAAVTGLFRNVYNDYSDVQCHAELVLAIVSALDAICTVIHDQSVTGAIRGALRINFAHRTFKECERILFKKNNWVSDESKDHFASGVNLGLGGFELVISYFPQKFIKLLEFAGFCGDRAVGVDHLKKAEAIKNGFMHPWVCVLLCFYYGFLEYFYGLGEPDVECMRRIHEHYSRITPKALAVTFGSAFFAQYNGDFDQALKYYDGFVTGVPLLPAVKTFENISYWQQIWLYAADCNWEAAAVLTKKMVDCSWKVSPATFSYIYACFLAMMAEDGRTDLRKEAAHYLQQVPKLKRNFGGKRAFHEKLVIEKSKQYGEQIEKFVMPVLDLMYIWNIFKMVSYKDTSLPKLMGKIDHQMSKIDKENDLDNYSRLTFMKGVCMANGKCPLLAIEPLFEVLDYEKSGKITHDHNLAPQACFEIGLVYRKMGDKNEAKKWLNKCKHYHSYITEIMINFRIQLAMETLT